MDVLTVSNLSKQYGPIKALNGISFKVPKGTVFGILGPNGSGKTTLLGIIMDVLKSSGGDYSFLGEGTGPDKRRNIGTLLETPNFYHYLTAVQNLQIAAAIKQRGEEDIERVLEMVNLSQRKNSAFSTYSLGMKQRLAIASALLGNPDVLVLDEPTNGLDPVGIAEIRELIKKLNREGKTVIMASHMLDEVEKVCTHVAILKKGNIMASGHVDEIFQHSDMIEIDAADRSSLAVIIKNFPGVEQVKEDENGLVVFFPPGTVALAPVNEYCFSKGVVLSKLILKKKSLESKFIELTN